MFSNNDDHLANKQQQSCRNESLTKTKNEQGERFIEKIREYKCRLLGDDDVDRVVNEQQSKEQLQQGQNQLKQSKQMKKVNYKRIKINSVNNNRNKQWQIYLYIIKKYKQNPFQLNITTFTNIIKQIITPINLSSHQQQCNQKNITKNNNKTKNYNNINHNCEQQSQYSTSLQHERSINPNVKKQQQQQQPIKQGTQQHNAIGELLQQFPQINQHTKTMLINQILSIEDITVLQLAVNIYSYINVLTFLKYQHFINQSIFAPMVKKYECMVNRVQGIINWWGDCENQLQQIKQETQQQQMSLQQCKYTQKSYKPRLINHIIQQHIKHKFYIQSFFKYYAKKHNKYNNIIKMLNAFCLSLTFQSQPQRFNLTYFIHTLHTAAYKRKHFLIASIIHTKCFMCSAQRFISSSLHQVKIYQKLIKKLNNFLYSQSLSF